MPELKLNGRADRWIKTWLPCTAPRPKKLLRLTRLGLAMAFLVLALAVGCGAADSPTPAATTPASSNPAAVEPSPAPRIENGGTAVPANTPAVSTDTPAPSAEPAQPTTSSEHAGEHAGAVPEPTAPPSGTTGGEGQTFVIQSGTTARYLVREQLARLDLPNDAVGETNEVSGTIAFDADGGVVTPDSKIVVNLGGLTSDSDRRDGYVRSRSLETDTYPTAEFLIQDAHGLPWPLPTDGDVSFQIMGDLTVHGVTKPSTWDVAGQFDGDSGDSFTGTAKTSFTFEDFDIAVPRVRVVLSVDNNIRLELDFTASGE